jgi:arylsulfatase A-like enzyme
LVWFLQLETFDPHEPFFSYQRYKDLYPHEYQGRHFDWPNYAQVRETPEEIRHVRYEYAALVSMCDHYLGQVLDLMDEKDLWKDTMLIVNTDHGYLLGEHDWWAKVNMPFYNEIARMPLFIWDPRCGKANERRSALVQTIDLAPTLLDFFQAPIPEHVQGKPLKDTIAGDVSVRAAALFGLHGAQVNCTDGKYVYMRGPAQKSNGPLYNYTLMPAHMASMFGVEELKNLELAEPFSFTKGIKTLKINANPWMDFHQYGTALYDVEQDPAQLNPIQDSEVERKMIELMVSLMKDSDAPPEQYERLGLEEGRMIQC